jgi:hypothetical protein
MNTFLLIDLSHLLHRIRHTVKGSLDERIGMSLHIILNSIGKTWRVHQANHIVFCLDGRSWRKDIYPPYKRNRMVSQELATPEEKQELKQFFDIAQIFSEYIQTKTNTTVLSHPALEADDLISGFIQSHPNDKHIIVSSDGDFVQLLASNVNLYNAVDDILLTTIGVFDHKNKLVIDKKTKQPKAVPDPAWSVFEKSIRGCSTDNVFSAYPGVRTKGSKNKVGLADAFADRKIRGFNWNNFMNQTWSDHTGVEHKVLDDYNRNVVLVDLTAQPENVKQDIFNTIKDNCIAKNVGSVGLHFLKFCGKYDLVKISDQAKQFSEIFGAKYPCQ